MYSNVIPILWKPAAMSAKFCQKFKVKKKKTAETFVDHSFKLVSKSSFTVSSPSRIRALFAVEPEQQDSQWNLTQTLPTATTNDFWESSSGSCLK